VQNLKIFKPPPTTTTTDGARRDETTGAGDVRGSIG
jgi:hypothetical protein